MTNFDVRTFYEFSQALKSMETQIETALRTRAGRDEPLAPQFRQGIAFRLEGMTSMCQAIGLELTVMLLEEIILQLNNPAYTYGQLAHTLQEMERRLNHELSRELFIHIPKAKATLYANPNIFGGQVLARFPSASFDIEEAAKCFALGRDTACVMHLMKVMEVALRAVGTAIGIPDPSKANWQQVIDQVNQQIKQKASLKNPSWLSQESFFKEVTAHLYAVKNAWRNPVMHVENSYDEERAAEILSSVKGFTRHVATRLDESGNFYP